MRRRRVGAARGASAARGAHLRYPCAGCQCAFDNAGNVIVLRRTSRAPLPDPWRSAISVPPAATAPSQGQATPTASARCARGARRAPAAAPRPVRRRGRAAAAACRGARPAPAAHRLQQGGGVQGVGVAAAQPHRGDEGVRRRHAQARDDHRGRPRDRRGRRRDSAGPPVSKGGGAGVATGGDAAGAPRRPTPASVTTIRGAELPPGRTGEAPPRSAADRRGRRSVDGEELGRQPSDRRGRAAVLRVAANPAKTPRREPLRWVFERGMRAPAAVV